MNVRRSCLLTIAAVAFAVSPFAAASDVLETARDLGATTYRSSTWGSSGEDAIDCVQFVLEVVREVAADEERPDVVTPALKRALYIQLSDEDHANLQQLVDDGDPQITGVQKALVGAGLGHPVATEDARPGDLVQYWYRSGGRWYGHSAIVEQIVDGEATLYGSHKSTLQSERHLKRSERKGGVGSGPVFDLTDPKRKVYVVRWIAPE